MRQGKMVQSKNLVNNDSIIFVENVGNVLYNVLMKEHNMMMSNGMVSETLHSRNTIAQVYNACDELTNVNKASIHKEINYQMLKRHLCAN